MSFTTFHTNNSSVSEDCLWIKDGKRYICVSYLYFPCTGQIQYAASVLKSSAPELTEYQITSHEHTTMRRFHIRPIQTEIGAFIDYDEILKKIRREMCHGAGCVGLRQPVKRSYDEESLSSVEMMSDTSEYCPLIPQHEVSPRTYSLKTVHCLKYDYIDEESHGPNTPFTHRTIFICFKGLSQTGDVLYGACIHHEGVHSLETAMMRLEKCPVQMSIPKEFRHQLKKDAKHREDVMYHIVDKIKGRVGGLLQIKGSRL